MSQAEAGAFQFMREGAVAKMDYEFIDDAFNLERVEDEATGWARGQNKLFFFFAKMFVLEMKIVGFRTAVELNIFN